MNSRYALALRSLEQLALFGVQPGTERLAEVLSRLDDPQRAFPAIHIAGTNGKGSTAAYAAQLLVTAAQAEARTGEKAGAPRRIGLYTSPHLLRVRERIQVSDPDSDAVRPCSEDELADAVFAVQAAAARAPAVTLTFFEVLTAAAFLHFAERGIEVAVIETGLGGRLDATRLCSAAVTVVTSIGRDHVEVLGPTLRDIAREKAGIFRRGVPALVACADEDARAVLLAEAERIGAPLWLHADHAVPGVPVLPPLPTELGRHVPLPGAHQLRNAALALGAVERLSGPLRPFLRRADVQAAGLGRTRWPGRLERITPRALPPGLGADDVRGREIWLDAAHNPEGVAALSEWLDGAMANRPLCVLFGVVAGKDTSGMTAPLLRAEAAVLTLPPSPRALALAALKEQLRPALGRTSLAAVDDWREALARALRRTPEGGLLLIYGSIFLIAAVRGLLLDEAADPFGVQDPAPRPA
jgi:dihydrofolate synthase/folylpolyglutamate synthase